jgi:hypothetical protein
MHAECLQTPVAFEGVNAQTLPGLPQLDAEKDRISEGSCRAKE